MLSSVMFLSSMASAQVDPRCEDFVLPDSYNEQAQQDYLANYVTLATSMSANHGPIPHDPGRGAIGLDLGVIPPLGCRRRLVLNGTKTEDTNKTPVVPRIRISFALPKLGVLRPYASVAYIPPVTLLGTTNVIVSGEAGVGVPVGEHLQVGGRYHFTLQRTVGEIATPFISGDEPVNDLYLGSSFGVDGLAGWKMGNVTPYLALGIMDVSTFFYIGDDAVVTNNLHPYFGPVGSLGVDALIKNRIRLGGELFAAPGGFSTPDDSVSSEAGFSAYGNIVTARLKIAVEL